MSLIYLMNTRKTFDSFDDNPCKINLTRSDLKGFQNTWVKIDYFVVIDSWQQSLLYKKK